LFYEQNTNTEEEHDMKTKENAKKAAADIKARSGVSNEFIRKVSAELQAIRKNKSAAS
jgi:hypothetical protein